MDIHEYATIMGTVSKCFLDSKEEIKIHKEFYTPSFCKLKRFLNSANNTSELFPNLKLKQIQQQFIIKNRRLVLGQFSIRTSLKDSNEIFWPSQFRFFM